MKKYMEYMDSVRASDTLHQRLLGLEAAGKRPAAWKKYGALAAALALVVGAGAWGLGKSGSWGALAANFQPDANAEPGIPDVDVPEIADIAIVEPGDVTGPGEKTMGGYDVTSGSGPNAMVTHYILPYIDYGEMKVSVTSQVAADWDIPQGATRRDLSQEEIAALMGGEDVLSTHLDWDGYQLISWGAWYEDGSFWGAYINGYAGPLDHFEFAVTANQLPPTCFAYPGSVTQEIRGLTITADGYDSVATPSGGVDASSRRVSFMKNGYGFRFDLTGVSRALTEERVSRLVRQIADKGLELTYTCPNCGHTFPFGAVHNDPDISAEGGYTCEVCGQTIPVGMEHYHTQDGGYTCANCGQFVPAGEKHSHTFVGEGGVPDQDGTLVTETCPNCGAAYPAGSEHECELCQLPVAPTPGVYTCPTCGEAVSDGMAHDCAATHICEVCGQTLPAGVEHSHQEDHHQEHHSGHH